MQDWEQLLGRWERAGLLDATSAQRIRSFEAREVRPERSGWQVRLALILGGVLLGAGVLLLVASHWDQISPAGRVLVAVGLLAGLHLGGVLSTERFPAMATALHAVGTVGAGAAIATVGQVFNMQEHWPAAVLLWALCAGVGWWLLRDECQQVCCLLLVPAWVICEWSYRAEPYRAAEVYALRMTGVFAAAFMVSFLHARRRVLRGVLFGVGGVALAVCVGGLSSGWGYSQSQPVLPVGLRMAAYAVMLPVIAGVFLYHRTSVVPVGVVLGLVLALPWLQTTVWRQNDFIHGRVMTHEASLLAYALVAGTAGFLAWWGVKERARALVNYGVLAFGVVVGWFYFSSLMDKLGRSLGLIGLGVLFLAGGWLLERLRRRLVGEIGPVVGEGVAV